MTAFTHFGTIAEYVEVDQYYIAHKPKNLEFDQAAGVPLVSLTRWQAMYGYTSIQTMVNPRVLILGGSSGTEMYAIQYAKLAGAHATVTASLRNEAILKSLGVDVVIDYRTQNWKDVIPSHSIDLLCDCGFEPNAWNTGAQDVLKKESGEYVTLHFVPDPMPSVFGATNIGGVRVHPSVLDLAKITILLDENKLQTVVDTIVPFDNVVEGITRVKSGRAVSKVVVQVTSS